MLSVLLRVISPLTRRLTDSYFMCTYLPIPGLDRRGGGQAVDGAGQGQTGQDTGS